MPESWTTLWKRLAVGRMSVDEMSRDARVEIAMRSSKRFVVLDELLGACRNGAPGARDAARVVLEEAIFCCDQEAAMRLFPEVDESVELRIPADMHGSEVRKPALVQMTEYFALGSFRGQPALEEEGCAIMAALLDRSGSGQIRDAAALACGMKLAGPLAAMLLAKVEESELLSHAAPPVGAGRSTRGL